MSCCKEKLVVWVSLTAPFLQIVAQFSVPDVISFGCYAVQLTHVLSALPHIKFSTLHNIKKDRTTLEVEPEFLVILS